MKQVERSALIVEEQPFVGLVASDVLEESGFQTFHAFDADDATRQLEEHPEIGLLILGADLPSDEHGVDFATRIARQRPAMQVLIAAERGHAPAAGIPAGARLLRKPFASEELASLALAG